MRLDRMISECGLASRTETGRACRAGSVTVNGVPVRRADVQVQPETDCVVFCGREVRWRKFVYLLLNKPQGYVSATEDGDAPCVTELVPEVYRRMGIFPCGRLDKYTTGLMLLTNDGPLAHRLLAPKSHVTKRYGFRVEKELSPEDICALEGGVDIGGYVTAPCRITLRAPQAGEIAITEGKYHQIKRMMEAVGNRITELERLSFGALVLDPAMKRGDWRELTGDEIKALQNGQPITKQERTERT
ncbi:MAG: pseudouridine synthase [Eubacteriales bacterium]|nr:pseudouridine synthase [Eubacteriales bacterium]